MVPDVSVGVAKKVGFIFFRGLRHNLPSSFRQDFQDGAGFSLDTPAINDVTWQKWLGLQWENIAKANAIFQAEMPTANPGILDSENVQLEKVCERAWVALKLTGPFSIETAWFVTGSEVGGEIEIRQVSKPGAWFSMPEPYRQSLADESVQRWASLFHGLDKMYHELPSGRFSRLNKGLLCFQKACEETYLDFRLPLFVRSVEALILPDKGKTTKQFVQRASIWWPSSFRTEAPQIALQEIYDIRCDLDYLHGVREHYSTVQLRRGYQAEAVARAAFQDVLSDSQKLEHFASDHEIKGYWERTSHS